MLCAPLPPGSVIGFMDRPPDRDSGWLDWAVAFYLESHQQSTPNPKRIHPTSRFGFFGRAWWQGILLFDGISVQGEERDDKGHQFSSKKRADWEKERHVRRIPLKSLSLSLLREEEVKVLSVPPIHSDFEKFSRPIPPLQRHTNPKGINPLNILTLNVKALKALKAFQAFHAFQAFQAFQTFQAFQAFQASQVFQAFQTFQASVINRQLRYIQWATFEYDESIVAISIISKV